MKKKHRSAITGTYVSGVFATAHPDTTISEGKRKKTNGKINKKRNGHKKA